MCRCFVGVRRDTQQKIFGNDFTIAISQGPLGSRVLNSRFTALIFARTQWIEFFDVSLEFYTLPNCAVVSQESRSNFHENHRVVGQQPCSSNGQPYDLIHSDPVALELSNDKRKKKKREFRDEGNLALSSTATIPSTPPPFYTLKTYYIRCLHDLYTLNTFVARTCFLFISFFSFTLRFLPT